MSSQKSKSQKNKSKNRRRNLAWIAPFASLKLTLTLLSLSMILVFVATLEQTTIGIRGALAKYFESFFAVWYYPDQFWGGQFLHSIPVPIPGGYLLGGLLILNLSAAYLTRFQWSFRKMGIQFIHLGVIMLLIGQLATQALQEESRMQINKGESKDYIERFHGVELVFSDVTDPNVTNVVTIPQDLLEKGGIIRSDDLPFKIKVKRFGVNCDFNTLPEDTKTQGISSEITRGVAKTSNIQISEKAEDFSSDGLNFGYLVFELVNGSESLGTWLCISHPGGNHWWKQSAKLADLAFQPIRFAGKLWGVSLRNEREYLPYSIELLGIENEFYQGTDIPFNFESDVVLKMEGNQSRRALVYMNTPLRHAGKTFYQYQMNAAADYTVFQVIRNPSWLVPYISCILVSIGLLWQFSFHLIRFLRKNSTTTQPA